MVKQEVQRQGVICNVSVQRTVYIGNCNILWGGDSKQVSVKLSLTPATFVTQS